MLLYRTIAFASTVMVLVAPAATFAAKSDDKKADKICREERSTGSILPSRICHSREQWAAIDARNGAAAEDTMMRSRQPGNAASRN